MITWGDAFKVALAVNVVTIGWLILGKVLQSASCQLNKK